MEPSPDDVFANMRCSQALSLALRLLNRKLGEIEESLRERVRSLFTEQLEALAEALLDFSTAEDLVNWLEENE